MAEILDTPRLDASPRLGLPEGVEQSPKGGGFDRVVVDARRETNRYLNEAEHQARELAEGRASMVETVLALNRADLSVRCMLQLRDCFVEAYREITRMQA
jgi:flagellar hook-basal body complex protein FliE